ncbi:MAG: UvrD-helicase domain-containing protein [Anaerolineales bacterium]
MELLQNTPASKVAPISYDFFFNNLEYYLSKGRGVSLFEADEIAITSFADQCVRYGCSPITLRLSSLGDSIPELTGSNGFVVIIQDLPFENFLQQAAVIADKLIFPFWFNQISMCFFSIPRRSAYNDLPLSGDELHKNYGTVINSLLCEQIFVLLERVNIQFSNSDFIHLSAHKIFYTPIEEKLLHALNMHKMPCQPQVRIGRYTVDFLVTLDDGNRKVIVECDGKAYHVPAKDLERDKVFASEGYPICHLSGAEILADVETCIEVIQKTSKHSQASPYPLDVDLDPSQMSAVGSVTGPIRVLAPAGSGKTKTLINRILNLLNQGIPSEKILALAFNKKARDEMQERLERKGIHAIQVRTFHSLGYEIVRESLGWTFSGSAHKNLSRDLMRNAIRQHTELPSLRNKDPLDAFLDGLRKAKMDLPPLTTLTVEYGERIYPFEPIFYSYLKAQLDRNYLDFDDMIYLALRVLLDDCSLRRAYQSHFEFVLVDEFQDLNQAQLLLLQVLSLPENNVFAVGDDDQMIYGFRGAEVRHIIEFDKRFPISSSHVLNTNYRSSRMIVRHTGWLIDKNSDRVSKNIQPRPGAQEGSFEISGNTSVLEQAEYAVHWLMEHKTRNNLRWSDYAFLYRYNAYQFPVAIVLDTLNIPHTPLSGQNLLQTRVGKDVYSYLQVILSPLEATPKDFECVLKRPNKYFTNQLIARVRDWKSFQHLPQVPNLRDWEREKLIDFISRIETLSRKARDQSISTIDFLHTLKIDLGLTDFYRDQSRISEDLDQASDVDLLEVIIALSGNFKTVKDFYEFVCNSIDDSETDSTNTDIARDEVYLGTIHRAKGKEFQNVVYFNLSKNGTFSEKIREEEERRVAYVGATRPKDSLLITFPSAKPSIFLSEICLNPKLKGITDEYLERWSASTKMRLKKERMKQGQLELYREKQVARFEKLTEGHTSDKAALLLRLTWLIANWRIRIAQEKIESLNKRIRTHTEKVVEPLLVELNDLDEEIKLRKAIKPAPKSGDFGQ